MFLLSVGFYVFIINRDIFQTEKYYVCAFGGKKTTNIVATEYDFPNGV